MDECICNSTIWDERICLKRIKVFRKNVIFIKKLLETHEKSSCYKPKM